MIRAAVFLGLLAVASSSASAAYPVVRLASPFAGSRFYAPNDDRKHTSIVMLHGSEGGSIPYVDSEANILATQGYAVLALCYFDCDRGLFGPKQTLNHVEAQTVSDAVAWLRTRTKSNSKVVVYGFSRGAELALIAGSLGGGSQKAPDAIIAHSPSDLFNGPWNWSWKDPVCWLCKKGTGQCSEGSPKTDYGWNPACGPDDPNQLDPKVSAWLVSGKAVSSAARIEIEKFPGPTLLTVGLKDSVWSPDQTRRVEATLRAAGRHPEAHYFPEQDHVFIGKEEIRRRELVLKFLKRI